MKKTILLATLILTLVGSISTQVYANSIEDNHNTDGVNQYMPRSSHYIALYSGDMTKSDDRLYIEYSMGSTLSDNKVFLDLQAKNSNGEWETINSWEKSYDRTGFGDSVEYYDSSSTEYRAKIKFCACISGVVAESKTIVVYP